MSKMLWNALVLSPAVLSATIIVANSTLAADNSGRSITQENTTAINLPAIGSFQERLEAQAPNTGIQGLAVSPSSEVNSLPTKPTQVAQVPDAVNEPSTNSTLDRINQYNEEVDSSTEVESLDQVTSVSQLRDVQPTDWAFQALQSLVERYGCIEGYPDRTYRGNRAMTRYEFAAGLNKCLDRIQELIAALPQGVSKEDLARLQRLQEEFAAELATLRGRVDALEARVNTVESQQFSTTTKLNGEVIFALASVFGDDRAQIASPYVPAVPGTAAVNDTRVRRGLQDNAIFAARARLNFDTSFTGKDLLRTRLQARNVTPFAGGVTGTSMTRLSFDGNDNNLATLSKLFYRFPIGNNIVAIIDAYGGEFNENVYSFNPLLEGSSGGAISRFGRFNPIYFQGVGGSGVTLNFNPQGTIGFSVGYLAVLAEDPNENRGLNGGNFGALAQLAFRPSKDFGLGLTYVRSYNPADANVVNLTGSTGGEFSAFPFGRNVGTSANHYGAQLTWRPAKNLVLSGWAGWTQAYAEGNDQSPLGSNPFANTAASGARKGDEANLLNWAVTLALPDLGRKGNVLGFVFGMPPKVIDNDLNRYQVVNGTVVQTNREDEDTSYHIEGLYKIQVTDNISVTPGVLVILNPEHWDKNDTIWVGTLRTTFKF